MEVQERQFTPWKRASWDVLQNEVSSRVWHINSKVLYGSKKQSTVETQANVVRILKSVARIFSSWSFVIRVTSQFLTILVPLWFIIMVQFHTRKNPTGKKKDYNRRQGWKTDYDIDKLKNPKLKILSWLWLLRYSTRYFQLKNSIFLFPSFAKRGSK